MYKFKSQATGDVIMLANHGDAMLKLLGRQPSAQGIFDVADLPGIIATLRQAAQASPPAPRDGGSDEDDEKQRDMVSLKARLLPVIEMLEQARAAHVPVVWGV